MSLRNSKQRFAFDTATGKIFCYLTSRYLPTEGKHTAPDGTVWDLAALKHAILHDLHIDGAIVGKEKTLPAQDKVEKANEDFKETVDAAGADKGTGAPSVGAGQSAAPQDAARTDPPPSSSAA